MLPERRAGEAFGPDIHELLHDGRGRGDEERLHPAQCGHDPPDEDEEGHGGEAQQQRVALPGHAVGFARLGGARAGEPSEGPAAQRDWRRSHFGEIGHAACSSSAKMMPSTSSRIAMNSADALILWAGVPSRNRRENGRSKRWVIRPGRGDMTMSLVPMNSASSTLWVMKNTVLLVRCQMPRMSSCAFSLVSSSRAPSGSSIRSTLGSQGRVRAMPTLCCMPPDSA